MEKRCLENGLDVHRTEDTGLVFLVIIYCKCYVYAMTDITIIFTVFKEPVIIYRLGVGTCEGGGGGGGECGGSAGSGALRRTSGSFK